MSHFYGQITESARKTVPTARAHKSTGLTVEAKTWPYTIETRLWHDNGKDYFRVCKVDNVTGKYEDIARGEC